VYSVAFSADGRQLATAGLDGLNLWRLSAKHQRQMETHKRTSPYMSVTFSSRNQLVAGTMDGTTFLSNSDSGDARREFKLSGHKTWVNSLAFAPDGITLASGSSDGTVRLWEAQTRRSLATFDPRAGEIRSVAWALNGSLLAAGTRYGTVPIW